ncbi:hypothetical protein Ocin01_16040 [Orchesella cincta]|uniref:Uncharacterized protein n=1 Tax=Orchesella cincta TaxID=48709 RepID=A0A1D2MCN3_ORCCI|nr:hypothetical protein Ocin01_16040 [Orchesella cincta]
MTAQQPLLLNKVQVEPPSSPTETVEGSILKSAAVTSPPYPSSNQEHSGDKTIPNSQADHDFLRDATSKHPQSTSAALLISPSVEKENLNTPQGTNAQGSRKRKSNLKDCESTYSVRKPKLASQSDTEENQTQPS